MKAWAMVTELSPRADTEGTWNLWPQETPAEMLEEQVEKEEDFCSEGRKKLMCQATTKKETAEERGHGNNEYQGGCGGQGNQDDLIREIQIQKSKGKKLLVKSRSREHSDFIILLFKPLI